MAEAGQNGIHSDTMAPHINGDIDDVASPASDDAAYPSKDQVTSEVSASNPVSPAPQEDTFSQQYGVSKDAPATPEALYENGNGASADAEDGSAESSDNPAREAQEPLRRMYFVRMPKPQEDNQYAVKALQEEIDVYKSQVQLLNESMNIVKMERDSTKNSVQDARESLNSARDAFDAKQREVDPLQQGRKQQGDAQRSFQQEYRDLEARSEAELDAKIKGMEFHMSHESMPIAEERNMVRHIKKLQDQRQRVRQYEAQFADVEEARATARNNVGQLKELQQERQVLFEDKQLQQTILNKHRDELRALDEKLNEIKDERARVKEQQDSAYHRMQALRNQSRGKKDAYYQNRRFSQEVRKLVKEGKLEEAKQMCDEQTDAALGHLHTNVTWREEYLELWKHQRPPPFRIGHDDYDFDEVPSQNGKGPQKGKAGKAAPVLTGKEKAQAIIAQALAEVRQDLTRKANSSGAALEGLPGASLPHPQSADHPAPAQAPPAESAAAVKPPKPSRAPKAAKPVEAPTVVDQREEEPFAPPAAVQKVEREEKADAEVVRQQQARAQEEAQRRKDKAAERKKKLAQKRKAQAAELKAQDAAAKTQVADQQQKPQADSATEEDVEGAPDAATEPLAAASTTIATVAASVADKASAAVKQAPAQTNKAMSKAQKKAEALKRKLAVPKARNVRREKGWKQYTTQCVKQAKQWGSSHPAELGLGVVVVLLGVMVLWLFSSSSSSSSVQSVS